MLASSNSNGLSYISTASIDGEINIKVKFSVEATSKYVTSSDNYIEFIKNNKCFLNLEQPNESFSSLNGNIKINNDI